MVMTLNWKHRVSPFSPVLYGGILEALFSTEICGARRPCLSADKGEENHIESLKLVHTHPYKRFWSWCQRSLWPPSKLSCL